MERKAGAELEPMLVEQRMQNRLIADDDERTDRRLDGEGELEGRDYFCGPQVTAHGVDRDARDDAGVWVHHGGRRRGSD